MSGSGKNFERGASPAEKRTLLVAEGKSGERAGGYRQTLKSEYLGIAQPGRAPGASPEVVAVHSAHS